MGSAVGRQPAPPFLSLFLLATFCCAGSAEGLLRVRVRANEDARDRLGELRVPLVRL